VCSLKRESWPVCLLKVLVIPKVVTSNKSSSKWSSLFYSTSDASYEVQTHLNGALGPYLYEPVETTF